MWEEPGEKCQKLKSGLLQLPTTVFSLQTHWAVSNLKKGKKRMETKLHRIFPTLSSCIQQTVARCLPRSLHSLQHSSIPQILLFSRGQKGDRDRGTGPAQKVSGEWALGEVISGKKHTIESKPPTQALWIITRTLYYPIWVSLMSKSRSVESAGQPFWRAFSHIRASLSLAQHPAGQHFTAIQRKHMTNQRKGFGFRMQLLCLTYALSSIFFFKVTSIS